MLILKKPVIIYVRNLFHRHNKYHHSTTSRQPGNPGTVATQAGAIVSSHTGFSHCTRSHYCHLDFHIQWFLTWIIHIEINITRHHPALWKASLTQPELRNVKIDKQDFTPKKKCENRDSWFTRIFAALCPADLYYSLDQPLKCILPILVPTEFSLLGLVVVDLQNLLQQLVWLNI